MDVDLDLTGPGKDDYTCPICMYILIHPVTMPCSHSLCMPCYKQCVEKTTLTCPLCRMRISSWARKQSRTNQLVDVEKWEVIQRAFPVQVKNRLEDKESSDDEWESLHHIETELRKRKEVSKPGAIRQEYEAALAQLRKQQEEDKRKEEEASALLIRALQEEEEEEIAELERERVDNERKGIEAALLRKQQEEDKRKEEEASALLIRALQEEEEEEIAELERERVDNERKGIEAALQLDREENAPVVRSASCNVKPCGTSMKTKTSNKPKKHEPSLKLDTFYETIRRTSCSAPITCKRAPSPSTAKMTRSHQDRQKRELSPYPYICISPKDKVQDLPSSSECSSPEWNGGLEPHLAEHSYTTLSARRIDLTSDSEFYMSCRRCDVPSNPLPTVKLEPLDISVSPQCEQETSSSFQPIESFIRTPPRKLPSGQSIEPSLVRAVPRNLCFEDHQSTPSSSLRAATGEAQTGNNCESCTSHLQAPDESTKMSSGGIDKWSRCKVLIHIGKDGKLKERNVSETASSCSSAASLSGNAVSDVAHNISKELEMEEKADCCDDSFITTDTPLLIPLEPDLSVCNIENEFQPLPLISQTASRETTELIVKNAVGTKHMLQEASKRANSHLQENNSDDRSHSVEVTALSEATSSKGKTLSKTSTLQSASTSSKAKKSRTNSNMSIRRFCVPTNVCAGTSNSRKRKASDETGYGSLAFETNEAGASVGSLCDNRRAQEEADHIYAMQLQNMYSTLDKHKIQVDRYKGSKDEYSFRKRRCL